MACPENSDHLLPPPRRGAGRQARPDQRQGDRCGHLGGHPGGTGGASTATVTGEDMEGRLAVGDRTVRWDMRSGEIVCK